MCVEFKKIGEILSSKDETNDGDKGTDLWPEDGQDDGQADFVTEGQPE